MGSTLENCCNRPAYKPPQPSESPIDLNQGTYLKLYKDPGYGLRHIPELSHVWLSAPYIDIRFPVIQHTLVAHLLAAQVYDQR